MTVIATGPLVHRSLEAAERGRGGGHLGRGRRPAHAPAARRGDARRVGQEDEPRGRRARGGDADGLRRRGRGGPAGAGLRLARRADRARRREVRAARVRAGDGAVRRSRSPTDVLAAIKNTVAGAGMANEVKLPRLGQGMESGTIVQWLKAEGDRVEKGEPLYELDTDKATQEVEAEASGVLLKIAVQYGEVPVGPDRRGDRRGGRRGPIAAPSAEPDPAQPPRRSARDDPQARARPLGASDAPRLADGVDTVTNRRRRARRRRAGGSRPRRSRAGWRASAGSSSRRSPARGPTAASSPRTSSAPRPRPPRRRRAAPASAARSSRSRSRAIRKTIARRLTAAWEVPVFELTVSVDMTRANALVARLARARPRRARHRHRPAREGLRAGAHAPPRRERPVHRRGAAPLPDRRTSASPSPRRRASSCR